MNRDKFSISVIPQSNLSEDDKEQIEVLSKKVFGHIPREEIENDFYAHIFAHVLAKSYDEVVGYTGLYKREVDYEGLNINIGGLGGLMTKENMRNKGIGSQIVVKTLEFLKNEGLDIAFHSIDTGIHTAGFYEKLGYKLMHQEFSWKDKKGRIKSDKGGMIALLNSPEAFNSLLKGKSTFYIGEGYW